MKVLLINGSPNKERCTYTALREVADALEAEGVDCEFAWVGRDAVRGCLGCGACSRKGEGRCVFNDDVANGIIEQAKAADGIVVGTPVFYAGANGALLALLDRMFMAAGSELKFKPRRRKDKGGKGDRHEKGNKNHSEEKELKELEALEKKEGKSKLNED